MITPFRWLALSLPVQGKSQPAIRGGALTKFSQNLNLHVILSTAALIIGMTI